MAVSHRQMRKLWLFLPAFYGLSACAVMHRSAIGEVLPEPGATESRVELGVDDIGVDHANLAKDVANVAKNTGNNNFAKGIEFFVWATTFSPRTGNPTTTDTWADQLAMRLQQHCPNGRVSGIQTLRESAEYPYVSGEIVRVRAICYRAGG